MHETASAHHVASVSFGNALMPQADAQNGNPPAKCYNNFLTDARLARCAWTRRNTNMLWPERCDLLQRNFVIPFNDNFASKLAKILGKIVRKRVVIIDK